MAEQTASGEAIALDAFRQIHAPLFQADGGDQIDVVVLACTHFPLVRGELAATVPHPVTFVDSGEAIARQTLRVLPSRPTNMQMGGNVWLTSPPQEQRRLVEVCRRFAYTEVEHIAV